jgi:hypothetical protein
LGCINHEYLTANADLPFMETSFAAAAMHSSLISAFQELQAAANRDTDKSTALQDEGAIVDRWFHGPKQTMRFCGYAGCVSTITQENQQNTKCIASLCSNTLYKSRKLRKLMLYGCKTS